MSESDCKIVFKYITVIATGNSGEQALSLCKEEIPDILLMDIQMTGMSGLEAGEKLLQQYPTAKILFLTTFSDDEYIIKALKIGAKGYLIKQEIDTIIPAMKAVMCGQSVFGKEIISKLPLLMAQDKMIDFAKFGLNIREQEVMELVANGLNNREIAEKLFLSEGTVRNYISVLLDKLDLRDRTQLAVFYYKQQ